MTTWETPATRYLEQRGAETLDIALTFEDGDPLEAASVAALTASFYCHDTAGFVFQSRNVLSSLGVDTVGTLALALSSDDLAMQTGREVETYTLTVSVLYATSRERHLLIPVQLRRVPGAKDMTP